MVKSSLILGAIAAFGTYVQAKEIKVDEKKAARLYDTGVMHNKLKASKEVCSPFCISLHRLLTFSGCLGEARSRRCFRQ